MNFEKSTPSFCPKQNWLYLKYNIPSRFLIVLFLSQPLSCCNTAWKWVFMLLAVREEIWFIVMNYRFVELIACAGFGWDNFLPSSWCGTVFWICAANSVDNTGMLCHDFPTYHQESPGVRQQENLVVSWLTNTSGVESDMATAAPAVYTILLHAPSGAYSHSRDNWSKPEAAPK